MLDPAVPVDVANELFGKHAGARALHAKGRFYKGTFTPTAAGTALTTAAHLQETVPVYVRWSNGAGHPRSRDGAPDVRGMAVSFRLPDGTATDIVAQTAPRFPVNTPEDFVEFMRAGHHQWRLPLFLARHPRSVPALIENLRYGAIKPPRSYATTTFFAIHAYKWLAPDGTARWVRYTLVPQATDMPLVDRNDRNYLQAEMATRLAAGPVRFTLLLQIAGERDDPHSAMSAWPKSRETVDAGTIEVTAEDPERETNGELIVFDPVRVTPGIELSDDPILRFRPLAYSVSAGRRAGGT